MSEDNNRFDFDYEFASQASKAFEDGYVEFGNDDPEGREIFKSMVERIPRENRHVFLLVRFYGCDISFGRRHLLSL